MFNAAASLSFIRISLVCASKSIVPPCVSIRLPVAAIVLPSKVRLSTFHSLTFLLESTVTSLFATIVPFADCVADLSKGPLRKGSP